MTEGVRTIIYPVRDLAGAKVLYGSLLGAEPMVDQPYYVGYRVAGQDVGLDPRGHSQGMTGPVAYWHVPDIRTSVQTLLDAGGTVQRGVADVGGGKLVASVTDADGNVIGLVQMP